MIRQEAYKKIQEELADRHVALVAVSKTKPTEDVAALYELGQRDFGENYVQELVDKETALPKDIRWHFIGHLQSNKVKMIAPFVHLIHGVDSFKLLQEISKQALKKERIIDVLLQMHIADEETKYGLDEKELTELLDYYEAQSGDLKNVRICGVMGMATDTNDQDKVKAEFARLFAIFRNMQQSYFMAQHHFNTCSMGMSGDYKMAIAEGSTMVRIGSLLFGSRTYSG